MVTSLDYTMLRIKGFDFAMGIGSSRYQRKVREAGEGIIVYPVIERYTSYGLTARIDYQTKPIQIGFGELYWAANVGGGYAPLAHKMNSRERVSNGYSSPGGVTSPSDFSPYHARKPWGWFFTISTGWRL